MTIRPAQWADLSPIAKLCAAAFYDDELFGPLMHPFREQFYSDYEAHFLRRMRENWWDYTHLWWVATVVENEDEFVVGVAEWELLGSAANGSQLWPWDLRRAIMPAFKAAHHLQLTIHPNRAANPDRTLRNPFPAALHFFKHHWTGARGNSLYLDLLAVHPRFQGRGLAKELMQWGVEKARELNVCASVVSSAPGYTFYRHMGFDNEVGKVTDGDDNPLKNMKGGYILFTDTPAHPAGEEDRVANGEKDLSAATQPVPDASN